MKKGKYVTLKIENYPDKEISYDIYFKEKEGFTYIGEFVEKNNALLSCKIKNGGLK